MPLPPRPKFAPPPLYEEPQGPQEEQQARPTAPPPMHLLVDMPEPQVQQGPRPEPRGIGPVPPPPPLPWELGPWEREWGTRRLRNLEDPGGVVPPGVGDSMASVNEAMRDALMESGGISDEDLEDREHIWRQHREIFEQTPRPDWMTLRPDARLQCWAEVSLEGMQVDPPIVGDLVELTQQGLLGYQEAFRILAHLVKDCEEGSWRSGPSGWMRSSVAEARRAIHDYRGASSSASSAGHPWSSWRGTGGSSSSSTSHVRGLR